jgi:glucokinase
VDEPVTLKTAEHSSFESAWGEFGRRMGTDLPRSLAMAFAGPVGGEHLKLTNNPWVIRPASLRDKLGIAELTIVNDFGAVAHSVAVLGDEDFRHLCGPERPFADKGVISIVGPGTGLGIAAVLCRGEGRYDVIETEGGHADFAPLDSLEDRILAELRKNFRRVSVERIASGRGLWNVYQVLCAIENRPPSFADETSLWAAAIDDADGLASAALDRFCLTLGAVAGDVALIHGAVGLVIAGGLGSRLADHLCRSGFRDRFIAKGRFERRMDEMPVKLLAHPNPGLFGAAAAFAQQHGGRNGG